MSDYGTLPTSESSAQAPILLPSNAEPKPPEWRTRLGEKLESKTAHWTVLWLVVVDALCVLTEIIVSFFEDCGRGGLSEHWFIQLLGNISLFITALFVLECLGTLIAFGPTFYLPPYPHWFLHLLDAIVVTTTLFLEIFLKGKEREVIGLLILFRFWRLIKIMEAVALGVTYGEDDQQREEDGRVETMVQRLEREKKKSAELKRLLSQNEEKVKQLEEENARLKANVV